MSLGLAMTPRSSTDVLAGSFSTAGSDAEGPVTDISKKQWLFFLFFLIGINLFYMKHLEKFNCSLF